MADNFDLALREEFARMSPRTLPDVMASPWILDALVGRLRDRLKVDFDREMVRMRLFESLHGAPPHEIVSKTRA